MEVALRYAEQLARRNCGIIDANLELLGAFFLRHAEILSWYRPRAGPIAFPRFLRGDAEYFCRDLLESEGVLLEPGALFGSLRESLSPWLRQEQHAVRFVRA